MDKLIYQAHDLFKNTGFDYAICGGFALDMFASKELRPHGDFDIVVFKEDKQRAVKFLINNGWLIYGRFMEEGKTATQILFYKINDPTESTWNDCKNMWAVKSGSFAEMYKLDRLQGDVYSYKIHEPRLQGFDFIELEFDVRDDNDFVLYESPKIIRPLDKAILNREGIPYLAPEVIMFFKSDLFSSTHPYLKPKTESDFKAIMPLLPDESREWFLEAINTAYPDGCKWLDGLI